MAFAEFIIGPAEGRTRWLNSSCGLWDKLSEIHHSTGQDGFGNEGSTFEICGLACASYPLLSRSAIACNPASWQPCASISAIVDKT